MKKTIFTIIVFLACLVLYVATGMYVTSLEWFVDPTDLQKEIFVEGGLCVFVFMTLTFAAEDLVSLLPLDKIRQKIFKRKSPSPVDPEETERPEP